MALQLTDDVKVLQTDNRSDHLKLLNTMAADQRIIESDRRFAAKATLGDSLERLWQVIDSRRGADPATSYTAKLLSRGRAKAAQKLGEEAVEAVIEAVRHANAGLVGQSADGLSHRLVLCASCRRTPAVTLAKQWHRHRTPVI